MRVRIRFKDGEGKSYGIGTTDGVVTYCCTATPAYFVTFPDGYSGYFQVRDCIPVNHRVELARARTAARVERIRKRSEAKGG